MKIGIVGLSGAGKNTLLATLINRSNSTPGRKIGGAQITVKVPDLRLNNLSTLFKPRRQVNATVEYSLLPDFEPQANGKRAPAAFLNDLKKVDAILLVLRAFRDDSVPHPLGRIDPYADAQWLYEELLLHDLAIIETRLERLARQIQKTNSADDKKEQALLQRCQQYIENSEPLRQIAFTQEEEKILRGFQFLTAKPILFGINLDEHNLANSAAITASFAPLLTARTALVPLSAKVEQEIAMLDSADQPTFLKEIGVSEPALDRLIRASYGLLEIISFFTVGEDECRAWTIRRGTTASGAARAIHSDIERGFIRAEVVPYDVLWQQGSLAACRSQGSIRSEGRHYIVQDGDIIEFLFNI